MPVLPVAVTALAVFVASWWLTGRLRRYALSRRIIDVPNARSSHSVATPRGGGMAIVASVLAALPMLGALGLLPWAHVLGLIAAGGAVAAVGFLDDHGHLAARWRLLGHFTAAWWLLTALGGPPPLPDTIVGAEWIWQCVGATYVVWILNLTNFMDGIDGLAAVEAITVSLGGIVLYALTGPLEGAAGVPLVLAAAAGGFLLWNWPPARIFMGDGGSGFVGLILASLSLQAGRQDLLLLWGWLILLGVFVTDATVTLVRRAARGERFYEAHRTHAYQHAAQTWGAHKPITLAVAAINVLWLLPIAVLVVGGYIGGLTGILIAYAPLVAAAWFIGAGAAKEPLPALPSASSGELAADAPERESGTV